MTQPITAEQLLNLADRAEHHGGLTADEATRLRAGIDQLRAEREQLLTELGGRDEEARERWIQRQLDETGLKAMDFRNGMAMEIEPARELVAHWVGAARAMLGDAPNYTETPIEMEVKVGESPERFAFVLQRVGGLTPHQARQQAEQRAENAEAELERLRARVQDWRTSTGAGLRLVDELRAERDALAAGVPLVCSDERHTTKVFALETALAAEKDISRRLLDQRQEMAAERFAWQERGDRAEAAIATFAAIFRGFGNLLATSSRDWATYRVDAWLWAVILGWDCKETEHDDTCIHGVMEELAADHGWDEAAVAKARHYRATVRAALDEHQEQPATAEQRAEETPDRLAHVGWWCWRGDNHGHLTTTPCRSDNVPLHAPTEWADDMRAVIQRIEDGDDEEEQP